MEEYRAERIDPFKWAVENRKYALPTAQFGVGGIARHAISIASDWDKMMPCPELNMEIGLGGVGR